MCARMPYPAPSKFWVGFDGWLLTPALPSFGEERGKRRRVLAVELDGCQHDLPDGLRSGN